MKSNPTVKKQILHLTKHEKKPPIYHLQIEHDDSPTFGIIYTAGCITIFGCGSETSRRAHSWSSRRAILRKFVWFSARKTRTHFHSDCGWRRGGPYSLSILHLSPYSNRCRSISMRWYFDTPRCRHECGPLLSRFHRTRDWHPRN